MRNGTREARVFVDGDVAGPLSQEAGLLRLEPRRNRRYAAGHHDMQRFWV